MLYQVTFSPTHNQELRSTNEIKQEDLSVVTLAPFTYNPKICFYGIKKGNSATRKLQINNPSKCNVEVSLIKYPAEDRGFSYSWLKNVINAESSAELEITWKPIETGGYCESINLQYGQNHKKAISIICKCVSLKKKNRRTIISPVKVKTPKRKVIRRTHTHKFQAESDITNRQRLPSISCKPNIAISTPSTSSKALDNDNTKSFRLQDIYCTPIVKVNSPDAQKKRLLNIPLKGRFIKQASINGKVNFNEKTFLIKKDSQLKNRTYIKINQNKNIKNATQVKSLKDDKTHSCKNKNLSEKTYIVNKKNKKSENQLISFDSKIKQQNINRGIKSGSNFNSSITALTGKNMKISNTDCQNKRCIQKRKHKLTCDHNSDKQSISNADSSILINNAEISANRITFERNLVELRSSEDFFKNGYTFDNALQPSEINNSMDKGYLKDDKHSREPHINHINLPTNVNTNETSSQINNESDTLSNISLIEFSSDNNPEEKTYNAPAENEMGAAIKSIMLDNKNLQDVTVSINKPEDMKAKEVNVENNIQKYAEDVMPFDNDTTNENVKKRRSEKIFGKKIKPPLNDLHNPDEYLTSIYLEEAHMKYNWSNAEELYIKKEVNTLLVPMPETINTKTLKIDKILQKCRSQNNTKHVKNDYITALDTLRNKATNLFRSSEVFKVISKIIAAVEIGKLSIGSDKNIHNNINLQQQTITLLLNYNPTWLRIGLETIFEETISPKAKSDITTICEFVMSKLFKNPYLQKKYKSSSSPKYQIEIKKHILRKFLMLIYFLDYSKRSKIMPNDPCLFRKNAGLKESKEILLIFSSRLLTPVRDILKFFETIGYKLLHKQTFIQEFNYVVENIEEDFKDGVRLVKLLDIVLYKDSIQMLRVPAISRLQKIHNVKVAFDTLLKAGCSIGDISPKDIVAGNRVKTLSLLMLILQMQNNCYKMVDNAGATI